MKERNQDQPSRSQPAQITTCSACSSLHLNKQVVLYMINTIISVHKIFSGYMETEKHGSFSFFLSRGDKISSRKHDLFSSFKFGLVIVDVFIYYLSPLHLISPSKNGMICSLKIKLIHKKLYENIFKKITFFT